MNAAHAGAVDHEAELRRISAAMPAGAAGEITILRGGEQVSHRFGNDAVHPARPRFMLGSISKVLVGIVYAQLFAEGRCAPHDPVNDHARRFALPTPGSDAIAIGELLTHCAGFDPDNTGLAHARSFEAHLAAAPAFVPSLRAWPAYSNFGAALAGHLLEDMLDADLSAILVERVFAPCAMTGTAIATPAETECEGLSLAPFFHGAGGYWSTPADLATLAGQMLSASRNQANALLDAAGAEFLFTDLWQAPRGDAGISCFLTRLRWNAASAHMHTGSWPGHSALLFVAPHEDAAAIALARHAPAEASAVTRCWPALLAAATHLPENRSLVPDRALAGTFNSTRLCRLAPMRALQVLTSQECETLTHDGHRLRAGDGTSYCASEPRRLHAEAPDAIGSIAIAFDADGQWFHRSGDRAVWRRSRCGILHRFPAAILVVTWLVASAAVVAAAPGIWALACLVLSAASFGLIARDPASLAFASLVALPIRLTMARWLARGALLGFGFGALGVARDPSWPLAAAVVACGATVGLLAWLGLVGWPYVKSAKARMPR